ncbi:hypothetical protein [Rhodanobacter sp. MP1X3]|uniref:DUF6881 domain-containing protein n=1 Tax=Rhodanobacter sp. MP1X3 TaxID=2723086 RepID=UPI00161A6A7E|nr:hypothetical protein [Rhodanobacter sp. MP1X3]MBB6240820.1 hypothetical protein [Rhodanobacter sp. MP1X3]
MEYIDVKWLHEYSEDPIRLVSELDGQRYEIRKLQFFRSGAVGFACKDQCSSGTDLGTMAVPSLTEINASSEFSDVAITAQLFEHLWHQHVSGCI